MKVMGPGDTKDLGGARMAQHAWKRRVYRRVGKRWGIAEVARVIKHIVRVTWAWCCMKTDLTENSTLDTAQASIFMQPVMGCVIAKVYSMYPHAW